MSRLCEGEGACLDNRRDGSGRIARSRRSDLAVVDVVMRAGFAIEENSSFERTPRRSRRIWRGAESSTLSISKRTTPSPAHLPLFALFRLHRVSNWRQNQTVMSRCRPARASGKRLGGAKFVLLHLLPAPYLSYDCSEQVREPKTRLSHPQAPSSHSRSFVNPEC
jgi:hypothetical protein